MSSIIDCFNFLWSPRVKARIKQHLVHLKLYEARLRELKAGIHNLKKARDAVQQKVDEEDNRYGRGIPVEVKEWIEAVNATISDYDKFDEEEDHQLAVFDLFKSGYLPKTGLRYRRSKKAFDITRRVNGLLQTANHDTFSYWLGPPSLYAFFHTVGYETFPSRGETMKKIKEALKSPNIGMVGLHGMSGVGKTTLVREIAREALQTSEAAKMFDVVAMVNVTRNPDIRKIQGQIADMLGMKLDEESDIARAVRIRRRLKNEKESTLIVLDDLWAALDLNVLGIPLEDDDGEHSWTKTMKEIPSGYDKEGKTPGEPSMTKRMKEFPSGNVKRVKTPGEHSLTKPVKEIPSGNVKEGKTPVEHSTSTLENNSSSIKMMKSRKLPNAFSAKTEETLGHYKGCKVLLISESKQVLLSQMEGKTNSIYFVEVLKEKEAEALFKKMAGIGDGKPEFDKLAAQIANKCNRLPMSIVTTARALKSQNRLVWEDVHRQLERGNLTGTSDFSTKLSYDLLEDEELKYAFLLCARMGPDALIMDLVKYCIGLGFLQEIYTVKEARDRVYVLVEKLKVSGLLSDSYSSEHFTMQDIVRNAALSIASKEKNVFTKTKGKIDEWPDKLERYAAISLHHCHIIEGFPRRINYPRLRVFHVNNNDPHLEIPKNFFKGMKELRVLILTGIRISPLDSSIASLTELRMLSMEQCMLDKELSIIGELKKLRILSFSGSDIERLPVELKQLKKLQIFDISNCSKLREFPSNVISSLISLEELYMRNTLIQWEVKEQTYQSENASLSELRHLIQLTTLDIQIPNADHLPKNLFFDKLYSYKIVIGDLNAYSDVDFKLPEKYEASRFLAIQLKEGFDIHSQKGIKMLFERVENLFLGELKGVQDIFYRLNLKGFPHLKHLLIVNNSDIQSLINPEDRHHSEKAFPKLESLYLHDLKNMRKICSCELSAPSFSKLKVIKINCCDQLENVFLFSVISLLTVLETLEVSECDDLKEIVPLEEHSNADEIKLLNFPELRSLTLVYLSKLIGFYPLSSTGGQVKELFHEKVEVPKLERMVLSSIQIDKIWSEQASQISRFRNLIHLDVNGCWNLEYLISFSVAKSLVNLQSLFIAECEKMRYIFPQGQGSHSKMKGNIFPNLKNIKLSSMKSLVEIWNSELPSNSFVKLDTLIIEECDKFVNVFPCYVEGMFQSLCNLRVTNCKSMTAVFELDDKNKNDAIVTNLQDVNLETLPKLEHVWKWSKERVGILELKSLQKMWVHDCHSLENIFPVSVARRFPNLEYLVIWDCLGLREIVAKGESTNTSFDFPKLTTIKLSELPKLSCFYPGPGAYKLKCPALNDLSIELCDRLEPFRKETTDSPLFSEEVINKLKSMQIESWHAKSSSSYIGEGNHRRDNLEELCLSRLMDPEILYSFLHRNPNLKSLSLNKCSFTEIVPHKMPPNIENLGVVPKLKSLKLIDLPDLVTIGFERDIILQRIEFLILSICPRLVNIMPSSVSLTHLTNLEVVNCDGLEKLMPLSAAKSLVQLNSMKVIKCESMVEIVGTEEENAGKVDIVFRQLKVLELVSLKNLNCFSKSCAFGFPSLEKLVVSACPKMENFCEEVKSASLLQKIFLEHQKKIWFWKDDLNTTIREIFKEKMFFEGMDEISLSEHDDLQQAWHRGGYLKRSWFYSLKILKLEDCENLSYAIPTEILSHLRSLKELEVRNCNKVKVIFERNDTKATPSQLKCLTLERLPELEHVWEKNCQGYLRFQNLQKVFVCKCERLQTLFPVALAKNLKKLEKLEIESCEKLLEIIGKEADVAETFVFPCLTWLDLYMLPELTYFYPGIFTVECPELRKLFVLYCPKLELFQTAPPEGGGEGISIDRLPLFSDLKAISILEELSVDWKHSLVLKSRLRQLSEDLNFLKEVRLIFDVDDNEGLTLPFDILEKTPNLQDMSIELCDSLEIFLTQNPEISERWIPGQLKILTLIRVSQLQCINLENSWLSTAGEMLHELNVHNCPDLTKLFHSPSAVCFSNLIKLYISECHELEYLFTSTVAKLLMLLEEITVEESQSIKEIVAKEQDGTTSLGIKFERLNCIGLNSLPSLECFYSGSDTLLLPSLEQMDIWQCPKMEVFSPGEINAKSFRGIQASSDSNDELIFHNDISTTVKRVFLLQILSGGMDHMKFLKHPELQEAWHDGLNLQNNWFYSLKILKLDNCDIEPYAIPSTVLPCLKSLKDLEVRNCNKVKGIFAGNDTEAISSQLNNLTLEDLSELERVWEKNCQGNLVFPNLQQVSVSGCKSMQTLFPAVIAKNLKMLEKLEIKSCDELREIVGLDEHATISLTKEFALPCLITVYLYKLPQLTYFYPEIFTVKCPKLSDFSVLDCPKLELFQGAHPKGEAGSICTSINRQPLIPDLNAISILEELSLDWKHISVLRLGQHVEDLKCLNTIHMFFDVDENEKPFLPLEILQKAPNLQDMRLGLINSLEIFLTQHPEINEHRILGQLKILTLHVVSQLQYINIEDSWLNTVCEKLHELNVTNCPDLTKLFHFPSAVSFSYLKELNISGCHGLKHLFTSSVAKLSMPLEKITVTECQSIVEIVAKEQDATSLRGIKFERLYCIDLSSLSSLECFFSGNDTLLLPSLTQVVIWQCPKVEVFSRGQINAKSFSGIKVSSDSNDELLFHKDLNSSVKRMFLLQMLSEGMDEMKFSEHPELQEAWHDGLGLQNNWFCSLKTLKLDNCDIEPYAIPSTILPCLKSLNELEVRKCNNVKVIFAGNDTQKISSQLNNLTLEDLSDLEHVWEKNYQASLVFPNLQQVSVRGCKSMQTLFPAVVAKNLKILEKLEIKSCDELREIVGKEEDAATGLPIKFVFPHLTSLYLYKLPELTYFYPEIFTVECPKLDDFSVLDCPKLELFQGAHHKADAENICTSINRQPLMSDLNAIFLEKLSLDWKHISVLMLGGHVEDLKSLNRIDLYFDVDENEKPTLPLEILEKAPNLQVLWLGLINSLEIFLTQHPKISEHRILGQLKILTLHMVSQLQYINLEDSWLNTVCEKLHELNVTNCPDLTKLFRSPSAVSFAYLKELNISGCHGLKYLFTSSVAKVLMLLEKITVKESESLVEIVAKEHDGKSSQGIRFELLYRIYLNSLSSLECFYSGTEPLLLPSLTQVDIWWCPKMDAFSRGEIDAKSFSGIQVSSDSNDELIFDSDLNPSVKRVFLLQMLSEGMDRMKFSKHPELLEAWRDGHSLHINWFFSLKTLKLDNCDFEQYAIPSNILPCLNNLKELAVRNCNKVKVIFDMNDTEIRETTSRLKYLTLEGLSELTLVWTENSQGILRFQNLQQVSVSGCKSMQTLFPAVLAKNLKMLEKLEINSCDELREIVGKKEDEATDLTIKFMFPCLTSLYLYKLPELTSFYPETFIVECPSLNNLFVLECLKLELFQRAYLEGEGESMSTSITRQPLFSDLKAICILEELSLNWRHIPVLSLGQHTEDLKYLNKILLCFYGDENGKPTLPVEILEKAPNLQAMTIECFHSLDIFLGQSTNIGERELFGHLKILKLANVSKLKFIWSKDSSWLNPICEKLHKLNVHNCHDLITLIHSPSAVSFSNLKELDITECDGLNYLFTCSTAIRLMHLENITIQNCSSMKQIVAKDQDEAPQGSKFMRLEWIVIHSLSSLECFYSGNDTLQLPSLTQVDICQCPNMKAFSEGPTHAKSFRGIKVSSYSNDDLVLYNNDLNASVEKVFLLQKDHLVFKHFILSLKAIWLYTETCPNWGFCNLKSLVMEGCEFLPDVILPSHLLPLLSNLKTLEVRKCNSVKAIFVHTKNGSQGSLSLPNLEKLCVENCVKLLEIVAKDETTKEANEEIIMFPRVALLRLLNLYNLRCIYPGMRILEWPMLTELYVMHCPVLNIFATEIESSRDSHPKCQDSFPTNQQALISLEKVTPSLKVLTLCKEEGKMIEQGKLHVDLQELDTLILQCFHDRTDVFPFVFRSKAPLPSTKHLVVRHSDFKEIFPSQTPDVDYTKILSQLRTLELRSLSQLKSIGLEHSWMGPFLENLQTMHVLHCSCLTSLTPSTVPFSKLRKLNVQNCNGLKYLFTSSTAKTLSVLKEMNLINCESIVEIVAKEDESNEGDMIFEQLNILTLSSLPKLGSFYMGSFTLNFSSLKEVSFKQCYNTKVFRLGDRVPDELKVTIDGVRWKGDKNEVIMQQIQEESA